MIILEEEMKEADEEMEDEEEKDEIQEYNSNIE